MAELLGRYANFDRERRRLGRIRTAVTDAGSRPQDCLGWQPHALSQRLSAETLDQIVQDYLNGDGCTVLSRRYGVSENGVLAHLRRAGVSPRPPGKVSQADVEDMARLRADGWTYAAIGARFGVTRSAVKLRLDRRRA